MFLRQKHFAANKKGNSRIKMEFCRENRERPVSFDRVRIFRDIVRSMVTSWQTTELVPGRFFHCQRFFLLHFPWKIYHLGISHARLANITKSLFHLVTRVINEFPWETLSFLIVAPSSKQWLERCWFVAFCPQVETYYSTCEYRREWEIGTVKNYLSSNEYFFFFHFNARTVMYQS